VDDMKFWNHASNCEICNQHPQSVASFHYEPMCKVGRELAKQLGCFRNYGPPAIAGPNIYVQDVAGLSDEDKEHLKGLNL